MEANILLSLNVDSKNATLNNFQYKESDENQLFSNVMTDAMTTSELFPPVNLSELTENQLDPRLLDAELELTGDLGAAQLTENAPEDNITAPIPSTITDKQLPDMDAISSEDNIDILQAAPIVPTNITNNTESNNINNEKAILDNDKKLSEDGTDNKNGDENITLAWFSMSSFEPPQTESELTKPSEVANSELDASSLLSQTTMNRSKQDKSIQTLKTLNSDSSEEKSGGMVSDLNIQTEENENILDVTSEVPTELLGELYQFNDNDNQNKTHESTTLTDLTAFIPSTNISGTQIIQPSVPNPLPNSATELSIPIAVDNPDWGNEFNQHIMWMGKQNIDSAIVKLNPESLGPIQIHIKMINDEANISIHSAHMPVRDMIEQALPKLKELMTENGVSLNQVNIEDFKQQSNGESQRSFTGQGDEIRHAGESSSTETPTTTIKKSDGLVDYFA